MAELLAPAGSYESLCAAVNAGADAVYIGGRMFGARAYADNPDEDGLIRGIEYCHLHGKKLYLTVNTLLKEEELHTQLYPYLLPYYQHGIDALIVQDMGVVRFVQECFPGLELHASTQMTVTGVDGARFLLSAGISRVVPARELSLQEIRRMITQTGIEAETFIHGAMCYCYSGQCLFSSMLGGRSGNRGRCAQPCRLPYRLSAAGMEKDSYLLSMKDMCTLELLPDLIDAGIASLKIEGRMKRPEYTAGVVSIYRNYIDLYASGGRSGYEIAEADMRDLLDLYNRGGFSAGYYEMHNGRQMMAMERPNHCGTAAARVKKAAGGRVTLLALEPLHEKDVLELPGGQELELTAEVPQGKQFAASCRELSGKSSGAAPVSGDIWYRTHNEELLQKLNRRYVSAECKEKIKGDLRISHDMPVILSLSCADVSVTVTADPAQPARNQPTDLESVRKQMRKTGNTPFEFESLAISLDEGLFLSIRQLNELRRNGLEQLREAVLLHAGRRTQAGSGSPGFDASKSVGSGAMAPARKAEALRGINVLVTSAEQLEAVLVSAHRADRKFSCNAAAAMARADRVEDPVIDTVYLDLMVFGMPEDLADTFDVCAGRIRAVKETGAHCFLSLPPVLRQDGRAMLESRQMQRLMCEMDGFLLHTLDELSYMKQFILRYGKDVILAADDSLYAYNRCAAAFYREQGIQRMTLPSELNSRELGWLDTEEAELNVYGFQPLMQSAQCIVKNSGRCTRIPAVTFLKDRKNMAFPVLNRCQVCCNTIYNSLPLQLGGYWEEVRRLAPAYVRLNFTIESGSEAEQILRKYIDLFREGKDSGLAEWKQVGTRGHFKRGVE